MDNIAAAQELANTYHEKAQTALDDLDKSVVTESEAKRRYDATLSKITEAETRLKLVYKKLTTLQTLHNSAIKTIKDKAGVDDLKNLEFSKNLTLEDGTEVDFKVLNKTINDELKALKKFTDQEINAYSSLGAGLTDNSIDWDSFNFEEMGYGRGSNITLFIVVKDPDGNILLEGDDIKDAKYIEIIIKEVVLVKYFNSLSISNLPVLK